MVYLCVFFSAIKVMLYFYLTARVIKVTKGLLGKYS